MDHEVATRLFYAHVWPHRAMVLRTAQFLTRNHTEAEDLAQETLVKAFKSIARLDLSHRETAESAAKAWLSTILRNSWIDRMRSMGRQERTLGGGGIDTLDPADLDIEDVSGAEQSLDPTDPEALLECFSDEEVIAALRRLPVEIRWTLLLVDVESMDHSQAAKILQIPEGTVKSRAHRGRRMLRQRLTAMGNRSVATARRGSEGLP